MMKIRNKKCAPLPPAFLAGGRGWGKEAIKKIAFLPGFGFKASIWENIAKEFTKDQCILIDLPDKTSYSAIIEQINNQLPDHCILVAWSLGGLLAIDLCLMFPEKFQKLVMVT